MGFRLKLTMELVTRVPPATLALELLQRIPERGYVHRSSAISEVFGEAGPHVPGRSVVRYDHVMHAHPVATMALVEAWQRLVLDALIVNWPREIRGTRPTAEVRYSS